MKKLLTSRQMQEADRKTIEELGLPGIVLMENAGVGVVQLIKQEIDDWASRHYLILAGRGNNGGDGFVIARRLLLAGASVKVLLLGEGQSLRGDAKINYTVFINASGHVIEVLTLDDLEQAWDTLYPSEESVVVDAVFGTGLQRPVEGIFAEVFTRINQSRSPVVAVDIPSGVDSDSGKILGTALKADFTVTFAAEKVGHR
ncbi:NAD(P)H-hydrate epimerase, partial [Magnetococcales bacterium HHB-1]